MGKLALEYQPFMVRELMTVIMSQVVVAAHEKNLECVIDIDPEAHKFCFVSDSSRIQQILANFGWNAAKFTAQGSVTFRMRIIKRIHDAENGDPKAMLVRFDVEDTGQGVAPEMQKVLFQPYEMGTFSRVGKYGGSGLGLNICKALAALLGAQVGCEQVKPPGRGAIFFLQIEMPVHAVPESSALEHAAKADAQQPRIVQRARSRRSSGIANQTHFNTPANQAQMHSASADVLIEATLRSTMGSFDEPQEDQASVREEPP